MTTRNVLQNKLTELEHRRAQICGRILGIREASPQCAA
jgi:hypothetical protein